MIAGILEIQLMANMSRLSDDMRRTERVVGDSMTKVERSVAGASRALSSLGLGVSIGLIADQMRRTADSFTKLDAQIRLSTKSQEQYNQALGDIRRISTIAQSDISATTMLYTRLLNTTDGMGISQAKLATVTETVSYGLKAYGATSAEAASAALQLSQAMGANRLGGEEFRAVMEAMPNVMKVLAKSMRVPLGELRALSIAGKITTAEMVKAFGDPAVAAEFRKMAERAQTITGAWTVARNELTLLFGEFAKSSGITGAFIAAFNGIAGVIRITAQYMDDIVAAFVIWSTIMGGKFVASLVAARMDLILLNAAHAEALAMNVAMEQVAKAKILSDIASTQATIVATAAKHESALAAAELSLAEQRTTIAQLEHARAAGLLSGHLYIVRTVEAELAVATDKLNASTAMRNSLMSRQAILHKEMIASTAALAAAETRLSAAEALVTASSKGFMARMTALVGKGGVIGLVIWGLYELFDHLGWIDAVFNRAEDRAAAFQKRIEGLQLSELEHEQALAQKELERQRAAEAERKRQGALGIVSGGFGDTSTAGLIAAQQKLDAINKAIALKREELHGAVIANAMAEQEAANALDENFKFVAERYAQLVKQLDAGKISLAQFNAGILKMYAALGAKPVAGTGPSVMERLREDLKAANEADVSGRLSNVEKVDLAWAKFTEHRVADEKMLADYQAALTQARIADWRKIRDQIADSITRGIMEGAKAEDVLKDIFKQMVLEPTVKLAVTAGVDWVASMLGNTTATTTLATSQGALIAALNANTAAQGGDTTGQLAGGAGMSSSTFGYAALFAAVAYYGFGLNHREMQAQPVRTRGVATRAGFEGEQTQDFTRQGGWFTSGDSYTLRYAISTAQHRAYKDAIDALQATYSSLAIQIGLTSMATQEWSVEIDTTGDVTKLLADGIGNQLLPALELFRKEGETLADTAKRLTAVFQSTNDFISALGVTSAQAFGSYGILSATQRQALIAAAGGEQAFSQFAGSFMTNILTPAERLKASLAAVGKVFATLGVTGINTKEQFADLVKEMLQKGDYSAVGALLSVSDAFAKITDSASEANAQLEKLLNKNTFETLVSYTRAAKTSRTAPVGQSISQAIEDATVTVSEEEKAARIANKQAALEKLNKLLADFNDLLNGLAVARNLHGWSDSLYSQVLGAAHNQWDPMISAARAYYDSLPAFATGGDHMGGLRLVGENGPELEATGPSRIYTASQTASMLTDGMGGGGSVADEVRMLRREAAAHAIALNTATQKLAKIADRWDLQGLPPERIAA